MAVKNLFKPKQQNAIRGRSSALIVTVVLHAVIFLVSGAIIVSKTIIKPPAEFEPVKVVRAKIPPKKLQVPVKVQKQAKSAPKMSNISSPNSRPNLKAVDLTGMPTAGGGGHSVGVDVGSVSLGDMSFGTSQINIFKQKGKGEKFLFALDTDRMVLLDAIGGIDAYAIIKKELLDVVSRLSPAVLFNVAIFDQDNCLMFSKEMSPATDENLKKLTDWLAPLNSKSDRYGPKTLTKPGEKLSFNPMMPIFYNQDGYLLAIEYAIQKGVDSMYWLGACDLLDWVHKDFYESAKNGKLGGDENGRYPYELDFTRYAGGKEAWDKLVAKAKKAQADENKERLESGGKVRVVEGTGEDGSIVRAYYPTAAQPPRMDDSKQRYFYVPKDILEYMESARKKYAEKDVKASLGLKKKKLTINVIHFVPKVAATAEGEDGKKVEYELDRMKEVCARTGGTYSRIEGLDAIKSASAE